MSRWSLIPPPVVTSLGARTLWPHGVPRYYYPIYHPYRDAMVTWTSREWWYAMAWRFLLAPLCRLGIALGLWHVEEGGRYADGRLWVNDLWGAFSPLSASQYRCSERYAEHFRARGMRARWQYVLGRFP